MLQEYGVCPHIRRKVSVQAGMAFSYIYIYIYTYIYLLAQCFYNLLATNRKPYEPVKTKIETDPSFLQPNPSTSSLPSPKSPKSPERIAEANGLRERSCSEVTTGTGPLDAWCWNDWKCCAETMRLE